MKQKQSLTAPPPRRKREVRRKSNWYIYVITMIITSALLIMVVLSMWDIFFPEKPESTAPGAAYSDLRPSASHNLNILLMLSDQKGGDAELFCFVNYRPRDEIILIVPIEADTVYNDKTFPEWYSDQGAIGVINAFEGLYELPVKRYVKLDRASLASLFEKLGGVTVSLAYPIADETAAFPAGNTLLNSADLTNLILSKGFPDGEHWGAAIGGAAAKLINTHGHGLDNGQITDLVMAVINTCDTSFSKADIDEHISAWLYTSQNSIEPAEFFVPYGTREEIGFIPDEIAQETVKTRSGAL